MKKTIKIISFIIVAVLTASFSFADNTRSAKGKISPTNVWSQQQAARWYASQPWLSGCNFQPSTAINQIEMWQAESFDAATIDKELGWAAELGFNTMRVYLSSVVWKNDPQGFKKRMDQYFAISSKHGIRSIVVFFDDCWNEESAYGKQPAPKPGVHNSGWVQDPSVSLRKDTVKLFPVLEKYVKDILTTFKNDNRILLWDLYNEPGNSKHDCTSLPLLKNVFKWARQVNPSQPISVGVWYFGCHELNAFQIANSDIVTYHNYSNVNDHQMWINFLRIQNRPMICTEYMARKHDSKFTNIMPLLKSNNIGAINWGFVLGKTNTIYAWDEPTPSGKEPILWFHDIYRTDHTAFDQNELNTIKNLNGKELGIKLISNSDFKGTLDGKEVSLYTLKNNSGMVAQITNFGGRVVALWTPDRNGKFADIVTGYKTFNDYQKSNEVFFGALIGRYGNRIANGKFTLNGINYQLPLNNGKNTLHGGPKGYHNVVWNARAFKNRTGEDALELTYLSPDGDEGFPGNVSNTVVYTLTNQNELKIEYSATTDKQTVINLTHHSFFNLNGFSEGTAQTINTHILQINGSTFTPTDNGLIPTGQIVAVKGTPMDFTNPTAIGERVNENYQPLHFGKGYDHNWILDKKQAESTEAAVIYEPKNGRLMRVITNQPALQFYGGNFFEGKDTGKYGEVYAFRTSFALETQHYPDSPNQPNFPSTVLNPGEIYKHLCIYKFEVK
jgi:galactose mutarotase-like enzyme